MNGLAATLTNQNIYDSSNNTINHYYKKQKKGEPMACKTKKGSGTKKK